ARRVAGDVVLIKAVVVSVARTRAARVGLEVASLLPTPVGRVREVTTVGDEAAPHAIGDETMVELFFVERWNVGGIRGNIEDGDIVRPIEVVRPPGGVKVDLCNVDVVRPGTGESPVEAIGDVDAVSGSRVIYA